MMVWFRWFSEFPGGPYSQVNHLNLPGCKCYCNFLESSEHLNLKIGFSTFLLGKTLKNSSNLNKIGCKAGRLTARLMLKVENLEEALEIRRRSIVERCLAGRWFQIFFIFIPTWGDDPFWLIFFRWVEATNQLGVESEASEKTGQKSEILEVWELQIWKLVGSFWKKGFTF